MYSKGVKSNRRVLIELDKILNIAVVTASIGRYAEIRHYLDGHEVITAWVTKEERMRWIARMRAEGFTGRRLATFLGVCAGTSYNDQRHLREDKPNWLINLASVQRLTSHSNIRVQRTRSAARHAH